MTVAVGVDGFCHARVSLRIFQKLGRHRNNHVFFHARELCRSRGDRLGALGLAPHDQHRLSECGRLLLKSAGVGHDHIAAGHQVVHLLDVHGVDQVNPLVPAQNRECAFAHHGA